MKKLLPIALTKAVTIAAPLALTVAFSLAAHAQPSSCSSDGVAQPSALLERFTSADCEACWSDARTPDAAAGALAIDWVTPGSRGDDAPLSAAATLDAAERIEALGKKAPADFLSQFTLRAPGTHKLRVAHGLTLADYIGTSIEMRPATEGPWKAWLLLVETVPKGEEGSPVERNLVRNSFVAEWPAPKSGEAAQRFELRPMRIAEGAKPSRLRVVGWLEDSRGRVRAIAQSRCRS